MTNQDVIASADRLRQTDVRQQFAAIAALPSFGGGDVLFPVRVGISLRDHADYSLADDVLSIFMHHWETRHHAAYELAVSKSRQGQAIAAIAALETLDPQRIDLKHLSLKALQYARLGHKENEKECLRQLTQDRPISEEIAATIDLCRFVGRFTTSVVSNLITKVEVQYAVSSPKEVAESIQTAIRNKQPYSLIRVGDGEGAWLSVCQDDELEFRSLYRTNRREFVGNWFGDQTLLDSEAFITQIAQLGCALANASHVGLPTRSWIEHEYRIGSRRGIPSLVNVMRRVASLRSDRLQSWERCGQMIHIDLLRLGFFEIILNRQKRLVIVTCHFELAELLAKQFMIDTVDLIKVPGAQQFKEVVGHDAAHGIHYPNRFVEISADLSKVESGTIVLVGAGPLGKLYCEIVRQAGGIAVDIGSVADVWMKKVTRPFSADIYDLNLISRA